MRVFTQLISSDAGLLSLAALAGVLAIGAFFFGFLRRRVKEEEWQAFTVHQ
ncbi:MAG TPA: DUF3149 domain-containing protein [Roseateles sp.]